MCPLPKMFQPQRLALFYHEDIALPSLSTRIRISEANSNGRIIEGVFKSFTGLSLMNVIKGVSSYGHLPFTISENIVIHHTPLPPHHLTQHLTPLHRRLRRRLLGSLSHLPSLPLQTTDALLVPLRAHLRGKRVFLVLNVLSIS